MSDDSEYGVPGSSHPITRSRIAALGPVLGAVLAALQFGESVWWRALGIGMALAGLVDHFWTREEGVPRRPVTMARITLPALGMLLLATGLFVAGSTMLTWLGVLVIVGGVLLDVWTDPRWEGIFGDSTFSQERSL